MPAFIKQNLGAMVTGFIALAGLIFTWGVTRNEVDALKATIKKIEAEGSVYAQQTRWMVDIHTGQIGELKVEMKRAADNIQEIKSDVRLIAEWVRQQQHEKGKHP